MSLCLRKDLDPVDWLLERTAWMPHSRCCTAVLVLGAVLVLLQGVSTLLRLAGVH